MAGLSYGTLLGVTAMAMFPDRVESVLLDGVMNADQYYLGFQVYVPPYMEYNQGPS